MVEIEKGIPVPIPGSKYGALRDRFKLDSFEIGDSLLVPPDIKPGALVSALSFMRMKYNKKFTMRKVPDGYRIWRVT